MSDLLPELTPQQSCQLEINLAKAIASLTDHKNDIFIVTENPGSWSYEITLNIPVEAIAKLIK